MRAKDRLLQLVPQFSLTRASKRTAFDSAHGMRLFEALRKAGVPE
jgi:hypothetical protein